MMTTSYLSGLPMRVRVVRYTPRTIRVEHGFYEAAEQLTFTEALLAGEVPGEPAAYLAVWAAAPGFTDWRIAYQYTDTKPLPGNWDVGKVRPGARLWKRYLPLLDENSRKAPEGSSSSCLAQAAEDERAGDAQRDARGWRPAPATGARRRRAGPASPARCASQPTAVK